MSDTAMVITEALREHNDGNPDADWDICCVNAILAGLKAAGYTIVSPATETCDPSPLLTVRWADGQVVVHAKGCGVVRTLLDDNRHTPADARELGAALLAAAEHAEAPR